MRFAIRGWVVACLLVAGDAYAGVVRGHVHLPRRAAKADSTLTEAVVYVDPLPDALLRKWANQTPTMRIIQQDRRFLPRVVAVPAGTTVRFQNRDDVYHNVFSVSPAKKFDIGKYPPHAVNQVTFDRPGVVNLFCDIHPKMAAYVLVLPHRFFTRPERDGVFSLPPLPAGSYTVRAWHPAYGRIAKRVQMPDRGDVNVDLRF